MNNKTREMLEQIHEELLVEGDPNRRAILKAQQLVLSVMAEEFDAEIIQHDDLTKRGKL